MKHLLRNIKVANCKVLAQFKVGDLSYTLNSIGKTSNISINGHDIIDCSDVDTEYDKIAHLLKDLIVKGSTISNPTTIQAYMRKDIKFSDTILSTLKKDLDSSIRIINQSKEIPDSTPVKLDLEKAFAPDNFIKKIKEFAQALHDINETLKVCREDIMMISCGRLVNTMWGAKPTQRILESMKNTVAEDENWERVEFYVNMILRSIDRLSHKLNSSLFDVCDEEKKVVSTVLIPNILQSFDKIKVIISNVLKMLSNFVNIDEIFKKNTSYPANWFINADMFEDIKLDYKNLVLFALKMPRFEQELLYPLDMMRHSFITKNKERQ
jgi:hypothetical protein